MPYIFFLALSTKNALKTITNPVTIALRPLDDGIETSFDFPLKDIEASWRTG